jgi:hypothetical protein
MGKIATRVPPDTKVQFVGSNLSSIARSRWLAVAASLVVSAGMFYAQGTAKPATHAQIPAAAPTSQPSSPTPPPGAPRTATPEEVQALAALAANAPTSAQDFQFALSAGVAPEGGLQIHTIWAARVISVLFPQITTIGGYRQDALRWHPNGLAIDVMIPNHHTAEGIELGNQIAGYALANAKRWGIDHVIWRQKIYPGVGTGSWTSDLGNETANHYDHVHIATDGGGYPSGHEVYYIASMRVAPH